uniref:Uncharacterized protein n=1 Tax=Timema poppense TaxID=170557 RepID=A0A7R9CJH4_TIMPO|nr:unnamed protein product [Timema poppensis]
MDYGCLERGQIQPCEDKRVGACILAAIMRVIHESDRCNPLAVFCPIATGIQYEDLIQELSSKLTQQTSNDYKKNAKPAKTSVTSPTPEASKKSSLVDLCEGKELEGFVIQQVSEIPDFHCKAYRLLHTATGAQYLHIYRNDSNNVVFYRLTDNTKRFHGATTYSRAHNFMRKCTVSMS